MKKIHRFFLSLFRLHVLPAKSYFVVGDITEILKTRCVFKPYVNIGSCYCLYDCEENVSFNLQKRYIRCKLIPTGTGLEKINKKEK